MNKDEVKALLTRVAGTYPNMKTLGTQTIDAWHEVFKDIDKDKVEKAFSRYAKHNKNAPAPSDIYKNIPNDNQECDQPTRVLDQDQFGYFVREFGKEERRFSVRDIGEDLRHPHPTGTYVDENGYLWAVPGE